MKHKKKFMLWSKVDKYPFTYEKFDPLRHMVSSIVIFVRPRFGKSSYTTFRSLRSLHSVPQKLKFVEKKRNRKGKQCRKIVYHISRVPRKAFTGIQRRI